MSKYTKRGRYALRRSRGLPANLQHVLDQYYDFADDVRAMWEEKIQNRSVCRKGCSHCCHLLSMIHFSDAIRVAQYLLSHQMQQQMEALRHMAELQKSFMKTYDRFQDEGAFVDAWLDEWIACPLLDEQGACTVYPVRPTACWHHASADVEGCKRENVKTSSTALRQPEVVEVMTKADFTLWLDILEGYTPLPLPTSLGIVVALGFVLNGGNLESLMEHLQPVELEDLAQYKTDYRGVDGEPRKGQHREADQSDGLDPEDALVGSEGAKHGDRSLRGTSGSGADDTSTRG